ncbi:MAG: c-type cytochrome domain-containing protein, partial [Planctomycetota bacterium]|nr:c-type cytochrome domain-containing protein [Planctomycetota bacterium]
MTAALLRFPAGLNAYGEDDAISRELFLKSVWPTFETKCLKCHDEMKQKGEYRLDRKEAAFKGGESKKPGIVASPVYTDDAMEIWMDVN